MILMSFKYIVCSIPMLSFSDISMGVADTFGQLVNGIARVNQHRVTLIRWSLTGLSLVEVLGFIGLVYSFLILFAFIRRVMLLLGFLVIIIMIFINVFYAFFVLMLYVYNIQITYWKCLFFIFINFFSRKNYCLSVLNKNRRISIRNIMNKNYSSSTSKLYSGIWQLKREQGNIVRKSLIEQYKESKLSIYQIDHIMSGLEAHNAGYVISNGKYLYFLTHRSFSKMFGLNHWIHNIDYEGDEFDQYLSNFRIDVSDLDIEKYFYRVRNEQQVLDYLHTTQRGKDVVNYWPEGHNTYRLFE